MLLPLAVPIAYSCDKYIIRYHVTSSGYKNLVAEFLSGDKNFIVKEDFLLAMNGYILSIPHWSLSSPDICKIFVY